MADNDSSQEKTEQATPKRREDAKKKGQVARSRELNTTLILLLGSGGMLVFGGYVMSLLQNAMISSFKLDYLTLKKTDFLLEKFITIGVNTLTGMLPILLMFVLIALLGPILMGGIKVNMGTLAPKFERISFLKGLKRIFAVRGLVELGKALLKFVLILTIALFVLNWQSKELMTLNTQDVFSAIFSGLRLIGTAFLIVSTSMIVVSLIDVPYQIYDHLQKLKMTKQEIRDEYKNTEGKPEVKSRIRQVQQEMSKQRMMEEVPKADVILTNPTHFSIALKYDQEGERAPYVVARGSDLVAFHIRNIAKAHNVTIVSVPPLARAIYYSTKNRQEIPQGLYIAVAQVLAYVYQLKRKFYPHREDVTPTSLRDIQIPEELQR